MGTGKDPRDEMAEEVYRTRKSREEQEEEAYQMYHAWKCRMRRDEEAQRACQRDLDRQALAEAEEADKVAKAHAVQREGHLFNFVVESASADEAKELMSAIMDFADRHCISVSGGYVLVNLETEEPVVTAPWESVQDVEEDTYGKLPHELPKEVWDAAHNYSEEGPLRGRDVFTNDLQDYASYPTEEPDGKP